MSIKLLWMEYQCLISEYQKDVYTSECDTSTGVKSALKCLWEFV